MTRPTRIAVFSATLLILVGGAALASQLPRSTPQGTLAASSEAEAPPTAEDLSHALDRLSAHDIDATEDQLSRLAADYGLGGAVRLLAWEKATGMSVADLRARYDDGEGWGQIAKDLGVSPGIGSIMGNGGGHGRESAPGQLKPKPEASPE